jgi:hypothetical protein
MGHSVILAEILSHVVHPSLVSHRSLLSSEPPSPNSGPACDALPQHIGGCLERDCSSDLLRSRLVCKHWHSCLSRCVTRLTLYSAPVRLSNASLPATLPPAITTLPSLQEQQHKHHCHEEQHQAQAQQHAQQERFARPAAGPTAPAPAPPAVSQPPAAPSVSPPPPLYGRHVQLIPAIAPTITHVTLAGQVCDTGGLRALARSLPALTSLSLQATRYPAAPPSQLQPQGREAAVAADPAAAMAPGAAADDAACPGAQQAAAQRPPRTSTGGACPSPAAATKGRGAPSETESSAAAPLPPSTTAVTAGEATDQGWWSPAPAQLERLRVSITENVPPDFLRRLLLLPPPAVGGYHVHTAAERGSLPPHQQQQQQRAEGAGRGASPLRELSLLPPLDYFAGLRRAPYVDLAPLLDPRLACVTRLMVPAMQSSQTPANGAGRRRKQQESPPPAAAGPAPVGATGATGQGPSIGSALGLEEVVGRLTQLRDLTVLSQVLCKLVRRCCYGSLP